MNFAWLHEQLSDLEDVLLLPVATPRSEPSWFGFPILVRETAPFTRDELTRFLEGRRIATRLLFGGNLTRQPAYQGVNFRTVDDLPRADRVMHGAFWVGVFPGLTRPMLEYVADSIREFCRAGVRA